MPSTTRQGQLPAKVPTMRRQRGWCGLMHNNQTDGQTNTGAREALMIKPSEAARIAGISTRSVTRYCESGEIKAAKFGRMWLINRAEFMKQLGIDE